MIEKMLDRAIHSRPVQVAIFATLYVHNRRDRYRGERRGAVSTRLKVDTSRSSVVGWRHLVRRLPITWIQSLNPNRKDST